MVFRLTDIWLHTLERAMSAYDITDEQFDELIRTARLYHRQSSRCMEAKAYLAGCVMVAAQLETLLMCACHIYGDEIPETSIPSTRNGQKPLLKWSLHELIRVARDCKWLPAGLELDAQWSGRKAKIGDYAIVLKQFRNLVHPGAYVADSPRFRITKQRLERCFEIVEAANDHLLAKIRASLNKIQEDEHDDAEATG